MKLTSNQTKKWLRIIGCFVAIGLLIIIGLFYWFTRGLGDLCGNSELSTTKIPGTDYKVVVFQRDCGATTGFSTQASIIKAAEKLNNDGGNIFSADDNHGEAPAGPGGGPDVMVKVLPPHTIEISHHPNARIFRAESSFRGIHISYSIAATANHGVVSDAAKSAAPHTP
jgi:hypothetical protein